MFKQKNIRPMLKYEIVGLPGSGKTTIRNRTKNYKIPTESTGKIRFNFKKSFFWSTISETFLLVRVAFHIHPFGRFLFDYNDSVYEKNIRIKRAIKIILISRYILKKNNCFIFEGVLHQLRRKPSELLRLWSSIVGAYGVQELGIIFIDLDPNLSCERMLKRGDIGHIDLKFKERYCRYFKVISDVVDELEKNGVKVIRIDSRLDPEVNASIIDQAVGLDAL